MRFVVKLLLNLPLGCTFRLTEMSGNRTSN